MLVPERVNFSIAVSGFISVTEMLNAIVVLVVELFEGKSIVTFGTTVSIVTVLGSVLRGDFFRCNLPEAVI